MTGRQLRVRMSSISWKYAFSEIYNMKLRRKRFNTKRSSRPLQNRIFRKGQWQNTPVCLIHIIEYFCFFKILRLLNEKQKQNHNTMHSTRKTEVTVKTSQIIYCTSFLIRQNSPCVFLITQISSLMSHFVKINHDKSLFFLS